MAKDYSISIPDGFQVKGYREDGITQFSIIDDLGNEYRLDGTVWGPNGEEIDYGEIQPEETDESDVKNALLTLFPELDNYLFYAAGLTQDIPLQDYLLDRLEQMGRNDQAENVLKMIGADDAGINEFYKLLEATEPEHEITKPEQEISPVSDRVTAGMTLPYLQADQEYIPWSKPVIKNLEQDISPVSDRVTQEIPVPYLRIEPGMMLGLRSVKTNPEQNLFPVSEKVTAAYTPSLAYYAEHPEQRKMTNILNNTIFAFTDTAYNTKQAFVHTLPNLLFPYVNPGDPKEMGVSADVTPLHGAGAYYTPEEADIYNQRFKAARDTFNAIYLKNKQEHEDWLKNHPEFAPIPEFQGDIITQIKNNPRDTGFILLNSLATTLPEFLAILGGTAASIITENPIPLFAAVVALTPSRIEETNNILLENGATESQSAEIGLVIGIISGALDLMPAGKLIDSMSPTAMELFTKTFAEETAKLVTKDALKQGIKNYTEAEVLQIVTGMAQQALQNTAVKLVDPEYSLFKDMIDEAINSGLQGLTISLFER
jgi:hypothetical protein